MLFTYFFVYSLKVLYKYIDTYFLVFTDARRLNFSYSHSVHNYQSAVVVVLICFPSRFV